MLPLRMSARLRRPRPRHVHFITMRVYYWRHFACYSFMLTLLGIHVVFQYAVAPNAGGFSSSWAPGEAGPLPDMAIACEQWIGRRSLKVPKSFMDQELSDVAPRGHGETLEEHLKERSRLVEDKGREARATSHTHAYAGALGLTPQTLHHMSGLFLQQDQGEPPAQSQVTTSDDWQNKAKFDKSVNLSGDNKPVLGLSAPAAEPLPPKQVNDNFGLSRDPGGGGGGGGGGGVEGPGLLSPGVPADQVAMETINARQLQWTGQKSGALVWEEAIPAKSIEGSHTHGPYVPSSSLSPWSHNHHSNQILDADGGRAASNVVGMSQGQQAAVGSPDAGALGSQPVYRPRDDSTNPHHLRYTFTCTNVHLITIKRKLGQGVTKQVYLGLYQGHKVAVKMVTRNVIDVLSCMKKLRRETSDPSTLPGEKHRCYTLPNMKLMKEILLLNQLNHPNLLRLQGYCVRSEETDSTSLQEHGIVAVYEYGLRFYVSNIQEWPWQLRIKTAIELADLLEYLQHSPLGSLRISDFKDAHFLLKDGRIKLTDLDDVTSLEPTCQPNAGPEIDLKGQRTPTNTCGFNLKCIAGICPGYNALKNLDNFHRLFFSNLLIGDSGQTEEQMTRLRSRLDSLSISASELKQTLYRFLDIPHRPGYL